MGYACTLKEAKYKLKTLLGVSDEFLKPWGTGKHLRAMAPSSFKSYTRNLTQWHHNYSGALFGITKHGASMEPLSQSRWKRLAQLSLYQNAAQTPSVHHAWSHFTQVWL
jgi:hypothetical protein